MPGPDQKLKPTPTAAMEKIDALYADMAFNKVLQTIWELISAGNKYIDETAPWALAKDPAQQQRLANVMYNLLEAIRLIALLVAPFMPETAEKILAILGCDSNNSNLEGQDSWGGLQPGSQIEKAAPLFPRIETE